MATINDYFGKGSNGTLPLPTTLSSQKTNGAASMSLAAATGWPTDTPVHCLLYQVNASNQVVAGTVTVWKGLLSGTTVSSLTLKAGTDATYPVGSVVVLGPTDGWVNDLVTGLLVGHNQDGTHVANLPLTTPVLTNPTSNNGTFNTPTLNTPTIKTWKGWQPITQTPSAVVNNGNRNYSLTFSGVDLTGVIGLGNRLQLTRTVTAPTQCTSLNGSTQFYSKSSPAAMTFTDDFTAMGWVKLTSYAAGSIGSRYNGTSGFDLQVNASGQVAIIGYNAGAANFSQMLSSQSLPLNRWVHVAANLDMSAFAVSADHGATGSMIMIDGVEVSGAVSRGGTNPTALVQAGNLEIGSRNAGTQPFPGKLAQVAVFNAKLTASTIQGYMSQGLAGSETSLISAYSFNNSINDLSANANNLTANGGAVATNADSPFAGGASADPGNTAGTTEFGIVVSKAFSTNTTLVVQVPIGYNIPTSGGVSAVSYSQERAPFGFPSQRQLWWVDAYVKVRGDQTSPTAGTWYNIGLIQLNVPIGDWLVGYQANVEFQKASTAADQKTTLSNANNTELDSKWTCWNTAVITGATGVDNSAMAQKQDFLSLAAAATYYLNHTGATATMAQISVRGDVAAAIVRAECAYL